MGAESAERSPNPTRGGSHRDPGTVAQLEPPKALCQAGLELGGVGGRGAGV